MKAVIKIENMKNTNKCICSAQLGRDLCKLEYKQKNTTSTTTNTTNTTNTANNASESANVSKKLKTYKIPKLVELYKHFYGEEFTNQHDASGDVLALLKCLIKM
jgi:hypothetical protein